MRIRLTTYLTRFPWKALPLSLAWASLVLSPPVAEAQAPPLDGLDEYVQEAMEAWQVPGLAVAVVHEDQIAFARGYGVQELDGHEPVDEHTLFGVGSTTKAMTTAALGLLVDEGRIEWDDLVIEHLPNFRLYDACVTSQATIRDLLTHQIGIGRMIGNRIQYMTNEPRSELIYRMRYLQPERPFRADYVYQNVMYMTAGEVIPAVTGVSWDDFLRERLFVPLGMTNSNTSIHQFRPHDPAASPHHVVDGEVTLIPRRDIDNVGPAGSVNSSVIEMAQWIRLHLNGGVYEGNRLLSPEVMHELHSAQVALPSSREGLRAYGLGWRLSSYHGWVVSQHGGGIDGMQTALWLVPEEGLGVIVLSNMLPNRLASAVAQRVVDAFLGVPLTDWSAQFLAEHRDTQRQAEEMRREMQVARTSGTSPSLSLDQYVGTYHDDLYGSAEVRLEGDQLELRFWEDENAVLQLHHWHHDTFRAVWPNPFHGEKWIWFGLNNRGEVSELKVEWNLRPPPSGYTRVATFRSNQEAHGSTRR